MPGPLGEKEKWLERSSIHSTKKTAGDTAKTKELKVLVPLEFTI